MAHEKVVAPRAMGMLQAAGDRINAGSVSVGLLRHPAARVAMHEPTVVTDQQDWRIWLRRSRHLSLVPLGDIAVDHRSSLSVLGAAATSEDLTTLVISSLKLM
jgi:hypothetical protein